MLQKFMKSSVDSTPVNAPSPPTVEQMFADLAKLRPNDPLLHLAPLDCFLADLGEKTTADGVPSNSDDIFNDLSKLSALYDEIRDAGELLGEKRRELNSLTRSAADKREELEGIVSWTTAEVSSESGGEETESTNFKG